MSRKRASSKTSTRALLQSVIPCPGAQEEYESDEYYRPGCYCTPQATQHVTPNTCAYLHEYVPQWTAVCSTATYVVDAYGMVYYLSDFEHQLQLPNNIVERDISYHYYDKSVAQRPIELADEEEEEEDYAASPRKRERFECEYYVQEEEEEKENDEEGTAVGAGMDSIQQPLQQIKTDYEDADADAEDGACAEVADETVDSCIVGQANYLRVSNDIDVFKVVDVVRKDDETICEHEK